MKKNLIQFPFLQMTINSFDNSSSFISLLRFLLNPIQRISKKKKRGAQYLLLKINSNHKSSFHIVLITSTMPKNPLYSHPNLS